MVHKIEIDGREVLVAGDSLSVPRTLDHYYFKKWLKNFDHKKMQIDGIFIQSADFFGDRVIFIKFEVFVSSKETGQRLPAIVFMRGDSIQVSVRVKNRQTEKLYYLLIRQPRVPIGRYDMLEIPAGMMDPDGKTIVSRALAELKEEAGITLTADQLRFEGSFVPSTGGSDEQISCFSADIELDNDVIEKLCAQVHGVAKEGEMITVFLVTPEEYVRMILSGELTDSKALVAALFRVLKFNPELVAAALAHSPEQETL